MNYHQFLILMLAVLFLVTMFAYEMELRKSRKVIQAERARTKLIMAKYNASDVAFRELLG